MLKDGGLSVWLDEVELTVGDSLRRSIDLGLSTSDFGVVILSRSFFAKEWPQRELDGLSAREDGKSKLILPVWHGISRAEVLRYSPTLADRLAASTSNGLESVAQAISRAIQQARIQGKKRPSSGGAAPFEVETAKFKERRPDKWNPNHWLLETAIQLTNMETTGSIIQRAVQKLSELEYAPEVINVFEVVCTELTRNAFEHACSREHDVVGIVLNFDGWSSSLIVSNPDGIGFDLEQTIQHRRTALARDNMRERGRGLALVAEIADELRSVHGGTAIKAVVYRVPVRFTVSFEEGVTVIVVISGVQNPSMERRILAIARRHLDTNLLLDFSPAERVRGSHITTSLIQLSRLFRKHGRKVVAVIPDKDIPVWVPEALVRSTRVEAIATLRS